MRAGVMGGLFGALVLGLASVSGASAGDGAGGAPADSGPVEPASKEPTAEVTVDVLTPGEGEGVPPHSWVLLGYKGMLTDGTVFDANERTAMALDELVPGFSQGVVGMQRGGRYRITIPPQLGYGERASGPIPANSTLVFEIDLFDFKTPEEIAVIQEEARREYEARIQAMIEASRGEGNAPSEEPVGNR